MKWIILGSPWKHFLDIFRKYYITYNQTCEQIKNKTYKIISMRHYAFIKNLGSLPFHKHIQLVKLLSIFVYLGSFLYIAFWGRLVLQDTYNYSTVNC